MGGNGSEAFIAENMTAAAAKLAYNRTPFFAGSRRI